MASPCGPGYPSGAMYGSPEARALHARSPAIDLHADSLMWSRWVGYDLHTRHDPPLPLAAIGGHVDVPRLREGGVGAQFFGLVSLPIGQRRGLAAVIHEQIDELDKAVRVAPDRLVKVRTAAEVEAAARRGAVAALLGIEGAHALEGEIAQLDHFARRGVRYLGLCHFSANEACFPAYGQGRRDVDGLTAFGREVVRRCEELGVIVDLAHINRRGFLDACAMATRPPMVSHTGVLGAFAHWRNIDDEQLRAVADLGGCVGVIFCPQFLGGDGLEPVVRHLKHIVDVVGEDAPALGSDWDGFIVPTRDLCDAARLPLLTDALLKGGFSEVQIRKLLRDNALRVIRDNPVPA
ncbi:peptidase M19, renal dipeptidase [Chondromyces apiculatus DSM 436]|uniref:Peptidase M19, renal dipeptidase n=2 Tax=Chondromyces apiculatus TaxID=51 RepID=A0A017THM8_9BACT|nr:peptidase M19, renal dipeptidase [Chondromyces apiculatus DSM 436]